MIIYKVKNYEQMSKKASNIIASQVVLNPHSVLGLATGSTPEGTYKSLIQKFEDGDIDFANIKAVNLDEYKGLSKDDTQSYAHFMKSNLFSHINIDMKNTHIPNGTEPDATKECEKYNQTITNIGGIDLQLLGIGGNGHIGFNEPSTVFENGTHYVALAQETIDANARFFDNKDDVPKFAYSMGIGNIMHAKSILLVASGKAKAEAIYNSLFGDITPQVPASILQLHHNVTVVADEEALSIAVQKCLV